MSRFIPYLSDDFIERDAVALLADYEHVRGAPLKFPVPIEDIVEKYLRLSIEFDDTHALFGVSRATSSDADILGAMFFDEGRIVIDETLDPEEHPAIEGRYRFTLAHEGGGHWRLHRRLFAAENTRAYSLDGPNGPSVVCRSSRKKERLEWQADFHASCLLMPKTLVFRAWRDRFGSMQPLTYAKFGTSVRFDRPHGQRPRQIGEVLNRSRYDDFADGWADYFARIFQVSRQATRIRLEYLGLLQRNPPHQQEPAGLG